MNKYSSLNTDIFSVFNLTLWKLENIKTFPTNFIQTGNINEFIKVSIIPSGRQEANLTKSVSGILMIDIFTEAGKGPTRANYIADRLDKYLAGQMISATANGSTQFSSSNMVELGADSINKSLYRFKYSIPFNYFGV